MGSTPKTNFENIRFTPFSDNNNNILLSNEFDPDQFFFNENNFQAMEANYFSADERSKKLREISDDTFFSLFHLNIRSMNKNNSNYYENVNINSA